MDQILRTKTPPRSVEAASARRGPEGAVFMCNTPALLTAGGSLAGECVSFVLRSSLSPLRRATPCRGASSHEDGDGIGDQPHLALC